MDPNTAYETMMNEHLDIEERADNAAALVSWLANGGMLPDHYKERNVPWDGDIERVQVMNARAKCATVLTAAWNRR